MGVPTYRPFRGRQYPHGATPATAPALNREQKKKQKNYLLRNRRTKKRSRARKSVRRRTGARRGAGRQRNHRMTELR